MRKFGIFAFVGIIFSLMLLKFDGDDEGGSDDIGDTEIPDDEGASEQTPEPDTVTIPKEEHEKTTSAVNQLMQEKHYNDTISRIKDAIPDFDAKKVVEHLKEMAKEKPELAAQYNNEIGFKLLWKEEFEGKDVENDPHNSGSNGASDVDMAELRKKADSGNSKAFDDLLDAAKA